MANKLNEKFYEQPTLNVARQLLGKYLIHKIGNKKLTGKIVETEAYIGPEDKASHASRGRTPRTDLMFWSGGYSYIYLIYGMYYCFNVVTEDKNYPAAILIRALQPISGFKNSHIKLMNGPGKLCREMKIDKKLNGANLTRTKIWIENRGDKIEPSRIATKKRIGIDYAGSWKNKLWRFYIINNPAVSKK